MIWLFLAWGTCGVGLFVPGYLELIPLQQLCSDVNPVKNQIFMTLLPLDVRKCYEHNKARWFQKILEELVEHYLLIFTRTSCTKAWYVHVWWSGVHRSMLRSNITNTGRWKLKISKRLLKLSDNILHPLQQGCYPLSEMKINYF